MKSSQWPPGEICVILRENLPGFIEQFEKRQEREVSIIFRSPYPDISIPNIALTPFVLQRAQELTNKPALIEGPSGRTLTYGELARSVEHMAAGLCKRGFQKGDVIAILSANLPEYAIVLLSASLLGGTTTTINPLYTADEISHQLNDAGARYLFSNPMFLEKILETASHSPVREVFVSGEGTGATSLTELFSGGETLPETPIDPRQDVVVLPYSSGTTGLPKGVMLTHHNLVANLCQLDGGADLEPVSEHDTIIAVLPFFHIYGMVLVLLRGLHRGATLVTMPRFDLEQFLKTMQDYSVTRAYLVPPIVLALSKHPMVEEFDLSKLRTIVSGAAPLSENLARACGERLSCLLKQGYGLTETSPVTHLSPESSSRIRLESIGPPIPNTECKVVDPATVAELGPNQRGEIWVRGPQVMKGYLNNAEATSNVIDTEGWLHTGDVGYADEDGYFYIVDRLKELIKYKGFQVAPAELEAVLLSHPAISDAAVIGSPDEEAGEVPKAFVVLKDPATAEEIIGFVAEHVAPHKKIRRLEFTDEIPKSASGKILRRFLLERERSRSKNA